MTTTSTNLEDWSLDNSDLYLNSNETDLLINALNSNKPNDGNQNRNYHSDQNIDLTANPYLDFDTSDAVNWGLKAMISSPETFTSYPPPGPGSNDKDVDGSDEGSDHDDGEVGDKRKADSPESEDGSGKRQETGKKTQKPGRKPLTSEPTTKRKAQNRAAQRAFRERKEKHLKDLEDKVDELQKKSDNANNENSILKAQVDRLQTELTEYRKRLSSATLQTSPYNSNNSMSRNSWDSGTSFNFEFPKFGANLDNNKTRSASTNQSFARTSASPIAPHRSSSQNTAKSPDLTGLFSADVLASAERASSESLSQRHNSRSDSTSNRQLSPSNTASPASSGFNGFTSSCVTTPEYTTDSVPEKINSSNTSNKALTPGAMTSTSTEASLDFGNFDWLASQNGGTFDPVLFGDYREPQDNIMNNDSWFFNDAFAMPELGSPISHTNSNSTANQMPKKTFMETIEDTQSGKEPEVVPGEQQFLTCNTLWDRVQKSQKVVSGEADMDDLCSQLKAKAKCSGKGAVISEQDVSAILGPATVKGQEPNYLNMFK